MELKEPTLLSKDDISQINFLFNSSAFDKDEYIFQAGTACNNIYLLNTGRIKLYRLSSSGKEIIQWFCFPGEIFGLAELSSSKQRRIYAQCCEECEVTTIPLAHFKSLLANSPEIAYQIVMQLSLRLKIVGDTLLNFATDNTRSRIIKLLIRLNMRFGKQYNNGSLIDITLTHKEIADMIGSCRQTVTSLMGDLKRDGYLELINHRIHIYSVQALEALLNSPHNNLKFENKLLAQA